jgi:hypothetical protein
MNAPTKKIWFPAKRYGWGWGLPCAWQGWVVLSLWAAALFGVGISVAPRHPILFPFIAIFMSLILVIICFLKGEKPRWRWGKD